MSQEEGGKPNLLLFESKGKDEHKVQEVSNPSWKLRPTVLIGGGKERWQEGKRTGKNPINTLSEEARLNKRTEVPMAPKRSSPAQPTSIRNNYCYFLKKLQITRISEGEVDELLDRVGRSKKGIFRTDQKIDNHIGNSS